MERNKKTKIWQVIATAKVCGTVAMTEGFSCESFHEVVVGSSPTVGAKLLV
jgi:hypothetical protein